MTSTYAYSIQNNFPNHTVDLDKLTTQIRASAIASTLDSLNTSGDVCNILFVTALSANDLTTLNGLVAAHDGIPSSTGATVPVAPVSFNNQTITNVADPTAPQMVATKNYVDTVPLKETSGPTTLIFGAIPANTYLQRSGTNVVGQTATQLTASLNLATKLLQGVMSAADKIRAGQAVDAQADLGFVGDLVSVFDGACSAGAPTKITSATALFTTLATVGQRITLAGAGVSGAMYVGAITALDSAGQVTVSPSISTTVSGKGLQFGTDNTAAANALITLVNTTNASFPGTKIIFGKSATNAYGFPIRVVLHQPVQIEGIGGGHTADSGDYTKVGGTRLAWWGNSFDGGTDFGAFFEVSATGAQALKRVAFRNCWLDCRNGDQNQALYGLKLASCHGFMIQDFFVNDALAASLWCNISSTPTEAKDTTRFSIRDFCFRQLDNTASAVTTPILITSAVALTTTPQSLTVAVNALPASGYVWIATNMGYPMLVKYTGGGGTTTLTGCTISAEEQVNSPSSVATGNVVQATPGNATGLIFDGGTSANTCCGTIQSGQISHGTTWGPAAIELKNSDSNDFIQILINGGNVTSDGAINRIRKPGVRLNGSATNSTLSARNNTFRGGSAGAGGVSAMGLTNAGARLAGQSGPNYWDLYQIGNGESIPVVEGNACFDWTPNGGMRTGQRGAASITDQAIAAATIALITGTLIPIAPQGLQQGQTYRWTVIGTSGAAGTAANVITIRLGTAGTTADAAIATFTTTAGTAVASEFKIVINLTVRVIGAISTAVAECVIQNSAASGFINATVNVLAGTMATFNSTTAQQYIHVNITTGTAKTITVKQAIAEIIGSGNP